MVVWPTFSFKRAALCRKACLHISNIFKKIISYIKVQRKLKIKIRDNMVPGMGKIIGYTGKYFLIDCGIHLSKE